MQAVHAVHHWLSGVLDALWLPHIFRIAWQKDSIHKALSDTIIYNGFCFLVVFLFQFYARPLIAYLLEGEFWLYAFTSNFLILLFYVTWIIPSFILSMFINVKWTQTIYQRSHVLLLRRHPKSASVALNELPKAIAAEVYTSTFYNMFLLQCTLTSLLPKLGMYLNYILLCWLYSLYCFEYKWGHWHIGRRLKYIEDNWAYFVGFGMVTGAPFTVANVYGGFFLSYTVWFLFFPFFLIMAIGAKPPLPSKESTGTNRVALFKFAKWLNVISLNLFVDLVRKFTGSSQTKKPNRKSQELSK